MSAPSTRTSEASSSQSISTVYVFSVQFQRGGFAPAAGGGVKPGPGAINPARYGRLRLTGRRQRRANPLRRLSHHQTPFPPPQTATARPPRPEPCPPLENR